MQTEPTSGLRRELGFWALVAYGVGDILGAGIYALVGEVAGRAGSAAWLSFLITVSVAALTALSYAELGSRFPNSGGEAHFCRRAIGWNWLATLVGLLVLCSGVTSVATVSWAFVGYSLDAVAPAMRSPLLSAAMVLGFMLLLSGVSFWGIRQSSRINIACTIVEVSGLLTIVVVGLLYLSRHEPQPIWPADEAWTWKGVFQGGALAFYAFIGFEDMVNVSEEVRHPSRNVPLGILSALSLSAVLYVLVVVVATSVVPAAELAGSDAPLLEVIRRGLPDTSTWWFTAIALFAVANTGLLNFVMGSRLLYGMAGDGLLPKWLHVVHDKTGTPYRTIGVVLVIGLCLALSGTLAHLAGTTNVLLMIVFMTVNASLIVLKLREPKAVAGFRIPIAVPLLGLVCCLAMVAFVPAVSLLTGGVLITASGLLVLLYRGYLARRRAS